MTSQEITVYREIQKNADNIIKAIDIVSDKVYDDALYMQLTRQSLKCAQLYNKASEKLLEGKADYFRSGAGDGGEHWQRRVRVPVMSSRSSTRSIKGHKVKNRIAISDFTEHKHRAYCRSFAQGMYK